MRPRSPRAAAAALAAAALAALIVPGAAAAGTSGPGLPPRVLIVGQDGRPGEFTSCSLAAPLGHSRPRDTGESGSPSIWVTVSLPFTLATKTFCPQPTAQYGQTDLTTRSAASVRGAAASVCGERTAVPRPSWSRPVSCR